MDGSKWRFRTVVVATIWVLWVELAFTQVISNNPGYYNNNKGKGRVLGPGGLLPENNKFGLKTQQLRDFQKIGGGGKMKGGRKNEYLRLKTGGPGEFMGNSIGEPSCEELRAMWRYYKRQSRAAELTNQIPQMQFFWDLPSPGSSPRGLSSFGPSSRSRSFLRPSPKGMRKFANSKPVYGRVVNRERSSGKSSLRPMDEVRLQMFGGGGAGGIRKPSASLDEPIIHYSPPPTKEPSSFQKLREEMKSSNSKQPNNNNNNPQQHQQQQEKSSKEKEFGKMRLSPPDGSDGRIVNKPKELMSSFEKIRFGHADDLLEAGPLEPFLLGKSQDKRRPMPPNIMLPMLKLKLRNRQLSPSGQASHPLYLMQSPKSSSQGTGGDLSIIQQGLDDLVEILPSHSAGQQQHQQEAQDFVIWNSQQKQPEILGADEENKLMEESSLSRSYPDDDEKISSSFSSFFQEKDPAPPAVSMGAEMNPTCPEIEGQPCAGNTDCMCVGYGLYRCHFGQCQFLSLVNSVASSGGNTEDSAGVKMNEGFDSWHSGPIQSSHLGLWEENLSSTNNLNLEDEANSISNSNTVDQNGRDVNFNFE